MNALMEKPEVALAAVEYNNAYKIQQDDPGNAALAGRYMASMFLKTKHKYQDQDVDPAIEAIEQFRKNGKPAQPATALPQVQTEQPIQQPAVQQPTQNLGASTQAPRENANGTPQGEPERLSFAQIASPLAALGIPVTPVRAESKAAFLPDWPTSATTDSNQIALWDRMYGKINCAAVATGQPDGIWIFETDDPKVLDRIQAETGHNLLGEVKTFLVRSRRGRGHVYFRNTPLALKMGNLPQTYVKHGDFSVRVKNQYVVAPGSIHAETKQPYVCLTPGVAPVPAPDWLVQWLMAQRVAVKTAKGKDELIPVTESGKIPHGYIHGWMVQKAGVFRNAGMSIELLEQTLLALVHEACEPPIDDAKVRQIARSFERYDANPATTLPVQLNQKPDAVVVEVNDEEEETFASDKLREFPKCPIFTGALAELADSLFPSLPLEFKQWGLISRWGLMRSGVDSFGFEKHLQPRFYSIFVCYPNTGKTACLNETRSAFELITQVVKTSVNGAPIVCAEFENLPSVDSGQFLADEFHKMSMKVEPSRLDQNAKIMMDPDEISDVFEKGRVLNGRQSTLFIELLKLHSGNRTGSGTKKDGKHVVTTAHLAILGGTTVDKYPHLWTGTGGGADGLVSRFIPITTNNPPLPPAPLPTDMQAEKKAHSKLAYLAQLPPQTVVFGAEAGEMLNKWWASVDKTKDSATRVVEIIKQLLIVLAVTNIPLEGDDPFSGTTVSVNGNTLTVEPELMQQAIDFGQYVMEVRELLNPGDSWTHVQAMENAVLEWAKKNASRSYPKTRNECRRGVQPQRRPGGLSTFNFAWDSCVKSGVMKMRTKDGKACRFSL